MPNMAWMSVHATCIVKYRLGAINSIERWIRKISLGYATNSNSFSPPRINTQSRVNGSGPFNSHASSPLHSSVHQSPYSPSYLSSSFTQRHLLNGASPYHSLGGASSGYHVNSNGVTNGNSPYQSVGGISESYYVNGNFSVHTTLPTRDYSSKPHPLLKTQVLEEKFFSSPRRVRISKPLPHDDYISRLENLQQRLSGLDSGSRRSRFFPWRLEGDPETLSRPCCPRDLVRPRLSLASCSLMLDNNILFTCNNHKSCHFRSQMFYMLLLSLLSSISWCLMFCTYC